MPPRAVISRTTPFRWDPERQLLVYDGSGDPDPNWKWVPEKGGYEPVENGTQVFDRRIGAWLHMPDVVN